ncbi:alpha/beta fold hydrolase [Paenibacillus sp. FSL H8-0260]|uniref:alpha/beta fold hydrolase n=1 Tax=Paenibacillus sp. FSL H8-0260 TaxID=2921380 RepID=UPI00324DC42B
MYFIVINCKIVGEGFPVVILHGWSLDHSVMSGCLEPNFVKRQGWKRIYIDLPGMGASKAQANIRNSDDMLQAVLDFITLQIPDEPFLIFGYSYGGLIARGVAHYLQKDVRGMLLIAPVIVSEPSKRNLPEKRVIKADSSLLSRLPLEDASEFAAVSVIQGEEEWVRFNREILLPSRKADHSFLTQVRNNGYGFTFEMDTDTTINEYPVLIITGRHDHIVGYKDAWGILDEYPNGAFSLLDLAGHHLQIEQPNIFNALVNNWLDELESGYINC